MRHEQIKVGVIGVGYLGRFHAQKYAAMEGVELVGVADIDETRANLIATETSCRPFTDHQALLPLVDAVSIVTPTDSHHQTAADCLRQQVDVLVEKPITATLAQADALINLAQEHKRVLQVGHLERFNPVFQELKNSLHLSPSLIECQRRGIFKQRGADVDVVIDLMIHDLDLVLALVAGEVIALQAGGASVLTDFNDLASASLLFDNGCQAFLSVSRMAKEPLRFMRLAGQGQALELDFGVKEISVLLPTRSTEGQVDLARSSKRFADCDALELELRTFIDHVRARTEPEVSGHQGRKALALALQVIAAINASPPAVPLT